MHPKTFIFCFETADERSITQMGWIKDIRIINHKGRLRNRVSQVNLFLITDKSQKPGFFGVSIFSSSAFRSV
jgi:hypothetical protein